MGMSANQASGIWQLSEASSYLRLARQYLELVQNVPVALDLYRDSRAILAQVNDPALDRITGMLTSDISLLNQITEVDTESLYIRLSELSQLVTEVRLGPSIEPSQAFNERESDNGQEGSEGGLSGLFSRYFTIQRLDAPLTLPLNVEQRSLLRQNMQLQIEQAKLALMQKRQAVYLDSISSVIMLAQQNIPDEDPQKMYLIRSLRELQNEAISLDLPALSDSLRLLDNLIINIR